MKGCQLPSEKELKKVGKGTSQYKCYANSGLVVMRWYDSKCVNIYSTFSNPELDSTVKHWDKKQKINIEIKCPNMIKEYIQSMGGVDLPDMLIALYLTDIKTRRWYLKILFHCVDICKINAWLLYPHHCNQAGVSKKKQKKQTKQKK